MSGGAHQLFDPEAPPLAAAPGHRPGSGGPEPLPTADPDPGDEPGARSGVLSIGSLYEEVEGALGAAFPRNRHLWVRGEIQHISDHRSGHLYLSLVDPGDDGAAPASRARGGVPTLNVKCWRSSWTPLRHTLSKEGITLTEGMVVVLRGTLDLYRAKGEISLILVEVDVTALLGRMAAQRAQLLRTLETEGLLGRNGSLRVPDISMHVGLIASPGTEGYQDFLGQLTGSGFGFRISLVPVSVQGPHAPAAIARALKVLSRSDCDVIAMVRGGERAPTWPPSRPSSWRVPWPGPPSPSSPASVIPVTRPWPTSPRRAPASRPPSAGIRSSCRPGAGGRPTWRSRQSCWPGAFPPSWVTPRHATRRPVAA